MSDRRANPVGILFLLLALGLVLAYLFINAMLAFGEPVEAVKVEPPALGMTLPGQVINIVDGDTLDVETRLVVRVRLRDCWSPESRTLDLEEKRRGLASKANLKLIAEGKNCRVNIPMSRFLTGSLTLDRVLGSVWLDGDSQDVSTQQVQSGFATRTKAK